MNMILLKLLISSLLIYLLKKACGLIDQKYSLFSQKRISMIKPFSSHKIIAKTKFNI